MIATLGVVWSCEGTRTPPAAEPTPDSGTHDRLFGSIVVSLRETSEEKEAYGLVSGTLYGGAYPDAMPMRIVQEEDDCQLREAIHPFCGTPCGSDAVCVDDDQCSPYPSPQDVAEITVDGLDPGPVTLPPFPPNFFYQSEELAYPPCSEGDLLRLDADAFAAEAPCIAPLAVDPDAAISVRSGEPVQLSWDVPGDSELARIQILLDVSHHGGKRGDVVCEVPDTGSYEIPASLVTALLDQGLAGFPSVILTRRVRSESTLPNVHFSVVASLERSVDTGVQSCLSDEECPEGQTCDRQAVICR